MDFLPTNWRTTLGGALAAAGAALQLAGQSAAGLVLQGIGQFLLGHSASDKNVSKEAVREVKQQVTEVKQDMRNMQRDVRSIT